MSAIEQVKPTSGNRTPDEKPGVVDVHEADAAAGRNRCGPQSQAEQTLMDKLSSGDESALQELIEIHGEMLRRLIGRLTAWNSDQDDLLQDVLVTVWNKATKYSGSGSLEGWLRSLAVNVYRNHYRKQISFGRLIDSVKHIFVERVATPSNELETHEITQLGLSRLKTADRALIALFYLEELPGHEIARILNINSATLHVRLHRARGRLKQALEELEIDHA